MICTLAMWSWSCQATLVDCAMRDATLVCVRLTIIGVLCAPSVGCGDGGGADALPAHSPDATSPDAGAPGSENDAEGVVDASGVVKGTADIGPDADDGPDVHDGPDADDGPDGGDGPDGDGGNAPDMGSPAADAGKTTEDVLRARGPGCLPCAVEAGALDDTNGFGTNCERFDSGAAVESCIDTLLCVLNTGCAGPGDSLILCLCGTFDLATCANATTPLNGACAQDYYAGYGTMNVAQFSTVFEDPTTPPGSANWLADLLGASYLACTACTLPMPNDDGGSDGGAP